MKRKLLSLLVLLMTAVTGTWADASWTSGDCTVTLSSGVMTISKTSGTGAMADYASVTDLPWTDSRSFITSVVVEPGVTHIGNFSFYSFTEMTSVSLPEGLETIGNNAFRGDNNVGFTSVNIPASVTSIGSNIFGTCQSLATVSFSGSNLTSISDYAFQGCISLGSIDIPAKVTSIGMYAFNGCTNLSSVTIPAKVTSIGADAFYNCSALGSIDIPAKVTSIGADAFRKCTSLTEVELPASVTNIGNTAFYGCNNLATVTLNSNPFLGSSPFPNSATVTMNLTGHLVEGAYWMTFFNRIYKFVADENTQVFKAELSGTSIILHEVTDKIVTNQTAVILKSTGNPVMTKTTTSSSNKDLSDLMGVNVADGKDSDGTMYVLNNGSQGIGFYKLASGSKLEANKAYLTYSAPASAPSFLGFGGNGEGTTGIDATLVNSEKENSEYYDLQGRRVAQPTKGLYIVNGKKVIIK